MMQVFKSKFADAFFEPQKSLFTVVWKDPKQKMTNNSFKETLTEYVKVLLKYKPRLFLYDATQIFFPIEPELQKWIQENSLAKTRNIVEKEAICVSNDLTMMLSAEQTLDEEPIKLTKRKIFTDKNKALKWLLYEEND